MIRYLPLWFIRWRYISLGTWLGDAISYSYMGVAVGYDRKRRKFERYEREWARRGWVPYEMADFVELGGYGWELDPPRRAEDTDE